MSDIKTVLGGSKIVSIAWAERMDDHRGEIPDRVINFARAIEAAVLASQPQAGGDVADALLKYGRHLPDCLGGLSSSKRQCTCGFFSAFEQACGDGAKDTELAQAKEALDTCAIGYYRDIDGDKVARYWFDEKLVKQAIAAIAAGKHKGE